MAKTKKKQRYRLPRAKKTKSEKAYKKGTREAFSSTERFLEKAFRTDFIPNEPKSKTKRS